MLTFRELFLKARAAQRDMQRCKRWIQEHGDLVGRPRGVDPSKPTTGFSAYDWTDSIDAYEEHSAKLRAEQMALDSAAMTDAQVAIDFVSRLFSDEAGQALADYYLGWNRQQERLFRWDEVSEKMGYAGHSVAKNKANAAIDWLDSNYDITEDKDGRATYRALRSTEAY